MMRASIASLLLGVVLGASPGCSSPGGGGDDQDTEQDGGTSTTGSTGVVSSSTGSTAGEGPGSDTTVGTGSTDGDTTASTRGDATGSTEGDTTGDPGVDDTACPDPANDPGRTVVIDPAPASLGLYATTGEIVVRGEEGRTTVELIPHGLGGGSPPLLGSDGYHAAGSNGLLALVPPGTFVSANTGNGSQCASGLEGDLDVTTGQFGSAIVHARFTGSNAIDVAVGNGDITVTMRTQQGATLTSAATGGLLTIDVPFSGRSTDQYASGELGLGSPAGTLDLSSFAGAIVIEPR